MRRDAQQNRERILAAAEAVFAEQGSAGSTEEVARRAGVGIATVFRHFPTKQALVEETLLMHFERLIAVASPLAETEDPADALGRLLGVLIQTGATKVTLASVAAEGRDPPARIRRASAELEEAVAAVLRTAQEAGVARSSVTVDQLYLLVRALAQVSATDRVTKATLRGATDIILTGVKQI